ncbi:MAG: GNAT family N-acetyltransferase [Chloroflexi bacterium]|nr:GNAT family N-acetyltransferase [Chloroflexota bacterium]
MAPEEIVEPIRTPRLDLVPISAAFTQALVDGDRDRARVIIGAAVGQWLVGDSAHVVQLAMAQATGKTGAPEGGGRVVVLVERTGRRRAIGSIGFHGPPDERGRLEVGCRIHPAYRGRGYAGEAMTAMFDWAVARLGINRFLVSVSSAEGRRPRLVTEVELRPGELPNQRIGSLERVLEDG